MFKSLLVPALSRSSFPGALSAALSLAEQYQGHAVACQVRQPFDASLQPLPYPLEMGSISQARSLYEKSVDELTSYLRQAFEAAVKAASIKEISFEGEDIPDEPTAGWIVRCGDPYELVSRFGRMNDIIVMQQCQKVSGVIESELRQRLLTEVGKPVLLVPETGMPQFPRSALIGWNGSLEATRALTAALPLLKKLEHIVLLTIGDVRETYPAASEARQYLRFHGILAEVMTVKKSAGSVTDQLRQIATDQQTDMLVLGGYSHSRMRERVFGGVTQDVLKNTGLPAFIVH